MKLIDNREEGGREVRRIWIQWAQQQTNPKPSHLVPWEALDEREKEADRVIWERLTLPYRAIIAGLETGNEFLLQAWKSRPVEEKNE